MMHTPVPKRRTGKSRHERECALELFLLEASNYGVTDVWLVGSMADGRDHFLSDVDLCVQGDFSLGDLYVLRDKVYLMTGVIIQLITDTPIDPKVKVYGS